MSEETEFCESIAVSLVKGVEKEKIVKFLVNENYWDKEEAKNFVDDIYNSVYGTREGLIYVMNEGVKKIIIGFLWFIGGIFATWFTVSKFTIGFVFIGAIFFGFIDMIIGLCKYLNAKIKYKRIDKIK